MRLAWAVVLGGAALLLYVRAGTPAAQFLDITHTAGIQFVHYKGNHGVPTILEEAGPGVCVADYDGDSYPDIYFVNGRDLSGGTGDIRNALYRNNGDGTFRDVTVKAGVPGTGYGLGCVWGDYDNDGRPDLYVTQYGKNVLYHNNEDGTFTDVTAKAHVDGMDFGTMFHTGATFFDYDKDGFLDLYAGGYVEFGPKSRQTCSVGGLVETSCPPSMYPGSPAVLYHNNRDGTFTNATKAAGIFQPKGKNLSVAALDYDNDGWPDLFVANDGIEFYLYHNNRNGTFTESAFHAGIALMADGSAMAAMCISFGDFDHDGELDLYVSDFQDVSDHLWRKDGKGFFDEVTDRTGIAAPTRKVLSFGGGFFDYDNDGWLDLFIANGHVYQGVEKTQPGVTYKQINSLFHNERNGKFAETTSAAGDGFTVPHLGRGAAFADFDNDGHVDVVVANSGESPLLLHNRGGDGNHFLNLKLVGATSNRDAMGARVKLRAGGVTQIREISGGGSYLSQSDLRQHFGLGSQTRVDSVEITWPSGRKQVFRDMEADSFVIINESSDRPVLLEPRR
jgi:enediyne biosynthesis protein E4